MDHRQKGIAVLVVIFAIGIAALVTFILFGHQTGPQEHPDMGSKINFGRDKSKNEDNPPTTYNLGIDFDDFEFTDYDLSHYNNKVFLENGSVLRRPDGSEERLPHPMYVLPPGTPIHAVSDGEIRNISYQQDRDDYSITAVQEDSDWIIDYDHVTNLKVEEGDLVEAGQVIAESPLETGALRQANLGFTEIMIFKDERFGAGNPTVCLFELLDESVKDKYHARIKEFVKEWEKFKGDENIYDEENWESPGCIVNKMREGH